MSVRDYNKLYISTNREEGSEKILLGYQHDAKELILKANTMTYFHIPHYTDPVRLVDSSLILDGATAGTFPAASDRIFKSRRNYGNVTADGNPSDIADGVWFCSWLYKDPFGITRWVDRYYNPGSFKYSIATDQLNVAYTPFNPIFRDVPSQVIFEPGVLYKYYHMGEQDAQFLVTTFGGLTGERLLMNLDSWGTSSVDSSPNKLKIDIISNAPISELYPVVEDADRITSPVVSFENNHRTSISLSYKENYGKTEEFTWSLMAKSPNWSQSQTTQLMGNFSTQGGVGVFVETLSSFPFFVVPETSYGHILYINEGINGFLDSAVSLLSVDPRFLCIDADQRVVVCHNDQTGFIYKLDNSGKIICSTRTTEAPFGYIYADEQPLQLLCGRNDETILRTNRNIYRFDKDLNLITNLVLNSSLSSVAAFRYNAEKDFAELDVTHDVYDSKFIGTTQWYLSRIDGNLYKKVGTETTLFYQFSSPATNLAVDPQERLWVLHGTNDITVINPNADPLEDPLFVTDVGIDKPYISKNISFICQYNRTTQSQTWKAIIYYADTIPEGQQINTETTLYCLNLDGQLDRSINLLTLFNSANLTRLKQNSSAFTFFGQGDFTGYEHRRVFKNLSPYKNSSQLVLRTSLKDKTKNDLSFGFFKQQISINQWDLESWQHIVLTLKNKTFCLYVNGVENIRWTYPGNYELSYELQPPFALGTPIGTQADFNQEIGYTSAIFNGLIESVKMYDYAVEQTKLDLFLRATIPASNIYWSLPVPDIQYIEKIERMFKNKIPGSKTPFYRIKIKGTQIQDEQTRKIVEEQVKLVCQKIQPAYADFLEVHWVD